MSEHTSIEWCDATVNIWQGCEKVAPGCKNCYAERDVSRFGFDVWGKLKPRLYCKDWEAKLRALNRKAARLGKRLKVFINSESDFFEDHRGAVINRAKQRLFILEADDGWSVTTEERLDVYPFASAALTIGDLRGRAFRVFGQLTMLDILLVTKRPHMIPHTWPAVDRMQLVNRELIPSKNIWLGASFSDAATLDVAAVQLAKSRRVSPVLFLSGEPLLEQLPTYELYGHLLRPFQPCEFADPLDGCCSHERNTTPECHVGACPLPDARDPIDWVILGGESGPNSRPCDVAWIRQLVEECKLAEVPVFVKQLGARPELHEVTSAAAKLFPNGVPAGAVCEGTFEVHQSNFLIDKKGGDPAEWPADLRVRQFPVLQPLSHGAL